MEVPITQFRRDIFALANRALKGETITVGYKGKRYRLTPLQIINPEFPNFEDVDLLPEMQREWEKDWEEQGLL
jgi:hypothetical protein